MLSSTSRFSMLAFRCRRLPKDLSLESKAPNESIIRETIGGSLDASKSHAEDSQEFQLGFQVKNLEDSLKGSLSLPVHKGHSKV